MKKAQKMTAKQPYWPRRKTLSLLRGFAGSCFVASCMPSPMAKQVTEVSSPDRPSPDASTSPIAEPPASIAELPDAVAAIVQNDADPDAMFTTLMPAIVETLQCDRCFLFIRDPHRRRTRITHGYSRENRWPTMIQPGWSREPRSLDSKDPLTLSAYRSPEPKFIIDIETAPPGTLDIQLERSFFGHRALIHAPIYADTEFYGILEPCVFDVPRDWTDRDRNLIQNLQQVLGSWIIRYLQPVP